MAKSAELFDVIVVGGGTAGTVAAVASARTGARTCLIESSGYLGGTTFALGNVVSFHNNRMEQVVAGAPQQLIDRLGSHNGIVGQGHLLNPGGMCGTVTLIDSAILNFVLLQMCDELGIELLLNSIVTIASVDRASGVSLAVANKAGIQDLLAQVVVDASGDAGNSRLPCGQRRSRCVRRRSKGQPT